MKKNTQPRKYRYDAFISYRHNPRDQQIASTLLRLLENLSVKGRPRLHIFRDREEFPTSSDLGNDIHKALEESEFLILICSPELLESKWCREELRYFRQLHGNTNRNILPLLVSGEPKDAFPPELFQELVEEVTPDGRVVQHLRDMEPLGADVRGQTIQQSLKALKTTEFLRIAAAILNCRFDDLYRREQRRLRRRWMTIAACIAAGALIMISFLLWQLFQVKQARLHEQLTYAQQLFHDADRLRAGQSSQEVLEAYRWPMDPEIQNQGERLQFLTGITPQFSVVTHLTPVLRDTRMVFSSDGESLLKMDSSQLERLSLEGETRNTFSLGNRGQKLCAISPDGTRAAILRLLPDGTQVMDLWDTDSQTCIGTLLDCALPGAADGLQADFSPDGSVLSVCRMGGYSNSNDQLCLFDGKTGKSLCQLDGALLGTLTEDGVQDRIVSAFSFVDDDVAHWTGGAYEVFYSISQQKVQRISRNWAAQYARAFPGCRLAQGRYAVLNLPTGITVMDFSEEENAELFDAMLALSPEKVLPVQMPTDRMAVYLEMTEQKGPFPWSKSETVLSGLWACDLTVPERRIAVGSLESFGITEPVVFADQNAATVYLYSAAQEEDSQTGLIRIDLISQKAEYIPLTMVYQELLFLGSVSGWDYFAGDTGEETVLFGVSPDFVVQSRTVDLSLRKLESGFDLMAGEDGVFLVGQYQQDYCLFAMDDPSERLDIRNCEEGEQFAVSPDGAQWLRYRKNAVTDAWLEALVGQELDQEILFSGAAGAGAFVGSTRQLLVWDAQGRLLHSQTQETGPDGIYQVIRSAKLSENGQTLVWMTSPQISDNVDSRNACTLHSYDLTTGTITDYRPSVYWRGDLPAENMYDCSADGTRIVFLSDAVIPELRILNVNEPRLANRQPVFPFDQTELMTNEVLTGVGFADDRHIVCTAGNCVALVDADSLDVLSALREQTDSRRMPQLLPDGTLVYFGNNLNFWDTATVTLEHSIPGNADAQLLYRQDGAWFAVADADGTTLYDAQTFTPAELLSSDLRKLHVFSETAMIYSDASHLYRLTFSS